MRFKMDRKVSVRVSKDDAWRSITIDLMDEKLSDGRALGEVLFDYEVKIERLTKDNLELAVANDEMKKDIATLQKAIKELVNLLKVGK